MGIEDTWGKAEHIEASGAVIDASQNLKCSMVKARYDRNGKQVLISFDVSDVSAAKDVLSGRLAGKVGRSADQLRLETRDNGILISIPAQVYVDKLGGEVPGFKRQIGD